MEVIRIKQVDAFTRTPFSGNPAGVVLDADFLDSKTMQKIAMEMNLSETAFVLDPTHADADIRIRWFTPSQEVNLCGHATIAAFHVLAEEGRFDLVVGEPQSFVVETKSGNLIVDVEWLNHHPYIKFTLPVPTFYPYPGDISQLCGSLGLAEVELSRKVKPMITDNGYCFVPITHFDSLKTIEPNRALLAGLDELYDLKGFAIYNRINKPLNTMQDLTEVLWKKREIENYFFSKKILLEYVVSDIQNDLFAENEKQNRIRIMEEALDDALPGAARRDTEDSFWNDEKASEYMEKIFKYYFQKQSIPVTLSKNKYYELIDFLKLEEIDKEMIEKLDLIQKISDSVY